MAGRVTHRLGECPRAKCERDIVVVVKGDEAYVLGHTCKGKPYSKKEK